MSRLLLLFVVLAPFAGAQVQLQFPIPQESASAPYPGLTSPTGANSRAVALPNGDTLLVGSSTFSTSTPLGFSPVQRSQIALAAVGPVPFQNGVPPDLLPILGGSGNDVPQAAAVDPSGNIWIAGETDSDDFNLVNPIVSQKVPYRTAGFVIELDPTGTKLLFATYLAGQQRSSPTCTFCYYATSITAVTVDNGGNVYLGGATNETDFPTTPGAFMTKGGTVGADDFGNTFFYSFVVKISPSGKLLYSTLTGTGSSSCSGGSVCITNESTSATVSSMAVDSTGEATVAGVKGGSYNFGMGYVTRLSADGSKLLWSADVGDSYSGVPKLFMAQDSAGNIEMFGQYVTAGTGGSIPGVAPQPGPPGLFAEKLSSDGASVLYAVDLGESPDANPVGIVLNASGDAYLAGTSSAAQLSVGTQAPNLGPDLVIALPSSSSKPQVLFRLPKGTVSAPPSLDANEQILLPGPNGSLLTLPPNYAFDMPAVVGFANSASYALDSGLTAGELVSLFGFDLGSENVQVQVLGIPATVLYASSTQINFQVPFEISSLISSGPIRLSIQVLTSSGSVTVASIPWNPSLGIFTSDGVDAAALNQDGSINSASNPAARGSVITLFGTGAVWPSGLQDGAAADSALALDQEQNRFQIVDSTGTPASLLYAGAAPGLIYGVFQINVQLPPDAVPPLTLQAYLPSSGSLISSNAVQIYLK